MTVIAPGSSLQVMYFSKQVHGMYGKTFLEIGPGYGHLTQVLINAGLTGTAIELSMTSSERLKQRFSESIHDGSLTIKNENFLTAGKLMTQFDLIVSAMVIEHLNSSDEHAFIQKCYDSLRDGGVLMLFVPANPKYWSIEDEVSGHFRRYTRQGLIKLVEPQNFRAIEVDGLTYPLSNILLPLSNLLVRRSESSNLDLERKDRTLLSGHREVMFKTIFPEYFRLILNRFSLYPFYLLQRIFKNHPNSMVIFLRANR